MFAHPLTDALSPTISPPETEEPGVVLGGAGVVVLVVVVVVVVVVVGGAGVVVVVVVVVVGGAGVVVVGGGAGAVVVVGGAGAVVGGAGVVVVGGVGRGCRLGWLSRLAGVAWFTGLWAVRAMHARGRCRRLLARVAQVAWARCLADLPDEAWAVETSAVVKARMAMKMDAVRRGTIPSSACRRRLPKRS